MKSRVQPFHPWLALAALIGASAVVAASDLPATLISYEKPAYPVELQAASIIEGYATVAFIVEPAGSVSDAVVLEATHVAFGRSVLDVLPAWKFTAEVDRGLPRREVIRFEFASKGVVVSLSHRDATKAAFPLTTEQRMPIRTLSWTQLIAPPSRLSALSPAVPGALQGSGKVEVSYIIDMEGNVRVPIVKTEKPDLGRATLAAVRQWRFAPPTFEGVPVLVEDMRSFTFAAK